MEIITIKQPYKDGYYATNGVRASACRIVSIFVRHPSVINKTKS